MQGYLFQERIGGGSLADVYRGWSPDGAPVALKVEKYRTSHELFSDLESLTRVQHPNLLTPFAVLRKTSKSQFFAVEVLPYVDWPTLEDSLKVEQYTPAQVKSIMLDLCSGLTELHGIGLVHNDVRVANVLMADRAVLADFNNCERMGKPKLYPLPSEAPLVHPTDDIARLGMVLYDLMNNCRAVFPAVREIYHTARRPWLARYQTVDAMARALDKVFIP